MWRMLDRYKRRKEEPQGVTEKACMKSQKMIIHAPSCTATTEKWLQERPRNPSFADNGIIIQTIGNGKLPIEILQEIFSHLDFLSLVCCRFTSRLWSLSVPTSFLAEHNKYLALGWCKQGVRPIAPAPVFQVIVTVEEQARQVDLYSGKYTARREYTANFVEGWALALRLGRGVMVNPAIDEMYVHGDGAARCRKSPVYRRCVKQLKREAQREAGAGGDVHWKKMFVSTPPVREIKVQCEYAGCWDWRVQARAWGFSGEKAEISIRDETGVKFEDFMVAVDIMIGRAKEAWEV